MMFTRHIKSSGLAQLLLLNADFMMFVAAIAAALIGASYLSGF